MAIAPKQIGWSQQSNLLWEISNQLDKTLKFMCTGPCTTTTNYNVAGCERMEYHVISYTGSNILPEGTIVNNDTPECWYIIDQTTAPADVGTVTYVWPTLGECTPCIDSHTTTTTTTPTPLFLVNGPYSYGICVACPPDGVCTTMETSLYLEQACIDLITVGCHVYSDVLGTINATQGYYARWDGIPGYLYIDNNGLVANIDVCPQP